jgi:lactoylglutathione lyase
MEYQTMKYLHTMIRVSDPASTIAFFELLGLKELRRFDSEAGRFTLIFLAAPGDEDAQVELTHNWDESGYNEGRNLSAAAGCWRHYQPPPTRRPYGVCPQPR